MWKKICFHIFKENFKFEKILKEKKNIQFQYNRKK